MVGAEKLPIARTRSRGDRRGCCCRVQQQLTEPRAECDGQPGHHPRHAEHLEQLHLPVLQFGIHAADDQQLDTR